jgi:hypothetical protein
MLKHPILCVALVAGSAAAQSPVMYSTELPFERLDEIRRTIAQTDIEAVIVVAPKHLWEVRDYLIAQGVPENRLFMEVEGGIPDARISVEIIGRSSAGEHRRSEKIVKSQGVR